MSFERLWGRRLFCRNWKKCEEVKPKKQWETRKIKKVVSCIFCFLFVTCYLYIVYNYVIIKHLQKLCLDLRSSYGVKTKAYSYALLCIHVFPTLSPSGLSVWIRRCKYMAFLSNAIYSHWKNRRNNILFSFFNPFFLPIPVSSKPCAASVNGADILLLLWKLVLLHP